ncbi:hypothetical protein OsJ_29584 [Oryza sativa Japonica Group]|uniref:Uncharacterized protein n=1 Tax=Oryza sativa subsp. japonica TaxID=39947 RepID=A3BZF3_ORYSJ|nr:hypothetical protein OsJ_29584 [Oryza sativa Japonica Group]
MAARQQRLDSASEAQPGCSPRPDETSASDGCSSSSFYGASWNPNAFFAMPLANAGAVTGGQGAALRSSPVYSRPAVGNVWLREAMGVRSSAPANTSLMTMSRCGWQWSEISLGECRFCCLVYAVCWGLRSFLAFLAEQPRQLKHLEWPGFRNTEDLLMCDSGVKQ